MARNKLSRGIAAVCMSGTLAAAGVISFGHPSQAAPKAAKPNGQTEARAQNDESVSENATLESGANRNIRLNYLQASWTTVLRDFAKSVDMTLVADRAPSSKFTRMDRTQYAPAEALKILNRELEMHGFRLIQKGNFLILIELPSFRTEYARPVVTPDGHAMANPAAAAQREVELLEPAPRVAKTPSRVVQADAETETRRPSRLSAHPIRQASATSDDAFAEAEESNEDIENAIKLTNHKASRLAKTLYEGFKSKARLIDEGPQGLPAFRVYHDSPDDEKAAARVRFTVSIDDDANELIVQGSRLETRAVGRLIKVLDGIAPVAGTSVKTMTVNHDAGQVAEILQPKLDRLAAASKRSRYDGNGNGTLLAQAQAQPTPPRTNNNGNQNAQPANAQPAAQPEQPPTDPLQGLAGGLKAEVTVESVPELGVIILRGNQADVEQVMEIIKEIERQSAGTIPDLEILLLEHVSSEGLSTLLTSVYDRLSPARTTTRVGGGAAATSTVTILPIARPNAIMIIAPKSDLEAVIDLARKLDQPIDPQTDYQIFRLKYAIASQVVTAVNAIYPAAGAAGGGGGGGGGAAAAAAATAGALSPRVRISADVRTNSVIVVARPRDLQEVGKLIQDLDKNESAAVNQMRIFPLKNATATDLATILQQSIQSVLQPPQQTTQGGQGGQFGGGLQGLGGAGGAQGGATQLRDVRSSVIQFMATDGNAQRLLRSGILADIRVTADGRTNSIVVTASEDSMPLMEELIKQLDRPTAAVAEIKVFTLANGDATQMVTLLQGLFPTQQTGQQGGQGGFGGQGGNQFGQQIGLQLAGADDVNSGLIPLRLSVDVRTNSIIAVGSADTLNVVYAILLRLDESDIQQRKTEVFRLKNISAASVSTSINLFLTTQRQVLTQAQPDLLSPFEQIEREVVVVPETVSNNLLISATPRYFDDIVEIVKKLDTPPQQVIIQALLVEVALDNTDEFGVELGLQDSILFKRSLATAPVSFSTTSTSPNGVQTTTQNIIGQAATPGFLFNNTQLGNNVGNLFLPTTGANITQPQTVGPQGLSHFSLGRTNNDLGYGGLVLSAGSESVSVLLRALAARRRVDVLSRPQIRTLDNQLAQIQVGQQVPTVSGAQTNAQTGVANPTITQRQTGIILTVTPRISPDQMVVMELIAEKSAINGSVPLLSGTTAGTAVLQSPIFDVTTARTVISVRDGQTIVLGGMITKNDETQERKVPILGDIPVLGLAFRYDLKKFRRTELLMFLTPRIIRNDGESELIKQIETERIHFIEQDAENLHGPILAVPGNDPGPLPGEPGFPLPPVLPGDVNGGATIVPPAALEPPPAPPKSGDRSNPNRTPGPMRGLQVPEFEDTLGDAKNRNAKKPGGVQPANYAAEAAPAKPKPTARR